MTIKSEAMKRLNAMGHEVGQLKRRPGRKKAFVGRCHKCNYEASVSKELGEIVIKGIPGECKK